MEKQLRELYQQRLKIFSETLNQLHQIIKNDESISVLSNSKSDLQKYKIDRINEICNKVIQDQKQSIIISILQAYHKISNDKKELQGNLNKELNKVKLLEKQLNDLKKSAEFTQRKIQNQQIQALKLSLSEQKQKKLALQNKFKDISQKLAASENQTKISIQRGPHYKQQFKKYEILQYQHDKALLQVQQLQELREYLMKEVKKYHEKFKSQQQKINEDFQELQRLREENIKLNNKIKKLIIQKEKRDEQLEKIEQMNEEKFNNKLKKYKDMIQFDKNKIEKANQNEQKLSNKYKQQLEMQINLLNQQKLSNEKLNKQIMELQKSFEKMQNQKLQYIKIKDNELSLLNNQLKQLKEQLSQIKITESLYNEHKNEIFIYQNQKQQFSVQLNTKNQRILALEKQLQTTKSQLKTIIQLKEKSKFQYQKLLEQNQKIIKGLDTKGQKILNRYAHSPNNRYSMKIKYNNIQLDQLAEEISQLQEELSSLKTGFSIVKNKTKKSIKINIDVLRKFLVNVKKYVSQTIGRGQQEIRKLIKLLQNKYIKIIENEKSQHKQKMQMIKKLCEEQIILLKQKYKIQQNEKAETKLGIMQKQNEMKEQRLNKLEIELKNKSILIQNQKKNKCQIQKSYNSLIKQFQQLKIDYDVVYSQLKQYKNKQYLHANNQKSNKIKNQSIKIGLINKQTDFIKFNQKYQIQIPQKENKYFNMDSKAILQDTFIKKLEDEQSRIFDNSRRVDLEAGFNELQDQIEAIIQRRNKRNAKFNK